MYDGRRRLSLALVWSVSPLRRALSLLRPTCIATLHYDSGFFFLFVFRSSPFSHLLARLFSHRSHLKRTNLPILFDPAHPVLHIPRAPYPRPTPLPNDTYHKSGTLHLE